MINLPTDTVIDIIAFLDMRSWGRLKRVCKRFRDLDIRRLITEYKDDSVTRYRLFGFQHSLIRSDGSSEPAVIFANGTRVWYRDGLIHRDDGPAIIDADGMQIWYRDGLIHRDDGPAIIWSDGHQEWYQRGQLHRDDGPAIVWIDGRQEWFQRGQLYRQR